MSEARPWWTREEVGVAALFVTVLLVYAGSVGGGFLNYDDEWLILDNPLLEPDAPGALGTIWADLSPEARQRLGAEYLPVRDTAMWLWTRILGKWPQGLRAVQLVVYAGACVVFRAGFRACFEERWPAEVVAWSFALHPVHVESAAWLAGHKDVMALLLLGGAFWRHALGKGDARWSVPLLCVLACLSKAMSVAFVGPLLATDLWLRRRPDPVIWVGVVVGLAATMAVHVHVGQVVGMMGGPLGESRVTAMMSVGPVWLYYLRICIDASLLSVRHDLVVLDSWTPAAVLGWVVLLGWGLGGLAAWWRGRPLTLITFLWFAVPLGPVSQVLAPLQNVVADRYAWLSVAAPLVAFAHLHDKLSGRWFESLAVAWILVLASTTALRAPVFHDSVPLFEEAVLKTSHDPIAAYQLGKAYEAKGRDDEAIAAFELALARGGLRHPSAPRSTNNLARLLARQRRIAEAGVRLRAAILVWPDNAKLRENLARVDAAAAAARSAPPTGSAPPG